MCLAFSYSHASQYHLALKKRLVVVRCRTYKGHLEELATVSPRYVTPYSLFKLLVEHRCLYTKPLPQLVKYHFRLPELLVPLAKRLAKIVPCNSHTVPCALHWHFFF